MLMKKASVLLFTLIAIACMAYIFICSSQPAEISNDLSERITAKITDGMSQETKEKIAQVKPFSKDKISIDNADSNRIFSIMNNNIRKYAHFALFLVLGMSSASALLILWGKRLFLPVIVSLLLCLVWAALDEFHQMFVPGRGPQLSDVGIDFFGSLMGVAIVFIIRCIIFEIAAIANRIRDSIKRA